MKKAFLIAVLAVAGVSLHAQDFVARPKKPPTPRPNTKGIQQQPNSGVVQKAFRSKNPLQMINPLAPKEYGDGQDSVSYVDTGSISQGKVEQKPKGIKFFSFSW
jgi:hypothetical protein